MCVHGLRCAAAVTERTNSKSHKYCAQLYKYVTQRAIRTDLVGHSKAAVAPAAASEIDCPADQFVYGRLVSASSSALCVLVQMPQGRRS